MRVPIFRVVNDDDPNDYDYPMAASFAQVCDGLDEYAPDELRALAVGQSLIIGGGAAVQFTLTRIR